MAETPWRVKLKLEGRIVSEWVALLEHECLTALRAQQQVILDFAEVTFVSAPGVAMLKPLASADVEFVNCSALVEDLIQGEAYDRTAVR
jgi:anti-anti-sigma regulatory factor